MTRFNLIQALMNLAFLITLCLNICVLITLMLVNLFVLNCKYACIYCILKSIVCTFYIKNDAEIFPVHYTWKVAQKGYNLMFL
jgi:hypothetical protein